MDKSGWKWTKVDESMHKKWSVLYPPIQEDGPRPVLEEVGEVEGGVEEGLGKVGGARLLQERVRIQLKAERPKAANNPVWILCRKHRICQKFCSYLV